MESFRNSRVAVLEPDQSICEFLTEIIRSWGLCVDGFTKPEAAIEYIRQNKCDIILLDVVVSGGYCLDLIPQFGDDLKIIMMTGFTDKDTAVRALQAGAFDLLEKPCENGLLYHSILRALTALENERSSRKLAADLEKSRSELLTRHRQLEDLNTRLIDTRRALSVFAQNIERDREEIEKRIALKLRNLILPVVMRLQKELSVHKYDARLDTLLKQIEYLTSGLPLDTRLAGALSTTEMQIASLIKDGMRTEEIARQLNISENTVRTHRKNIRKKLKVNNAQFSLKNFLNS